MEYKTVGEASYKLSQEKEPASDPKEYTDELEKEYVKNLLDTVSSFQKETEGSFFVVVTSKIEKIFHRVHRNLFYGRYSCPTPTYGQSVYYFDADREELFFLWSVPDQNVAQRMYMMPYTVGTEQQSLMDQVLAFYRGNLDNIARYYNNEHTTSQ